jgi:hypothetical protein
MTELPEATRRVIAEDIARRIADAPPPSQKSIDAVKKLARQFRLAHVTKEDAA